MLRIRVLTEKKPNKTSFVNNIILSGYFSCLFEIAINLLNEPRKLLFKKFNYIYLSASVVIIFPFSCYSIHLFLYLRVRNFHFHSLLFIFVYHSTSFSYLNLLLFFFSSVHFIEIYTYIYCKRKYLTRFDSCQTKLQKKKEDLTTCKE